MAISRSRVDNSELLNKIDRVSGSITDCINLAESTLRKKKSSISHEKTSPRTEHMGDIFSGIDHIDEKIAHCIKLAEDTLNSKRFDEQEYPKFVNPWATRLSDPDQDQAFIEYLDELDGPISENELVEWSDDIDLFMEGLSNPDKFEALSEQSKEKSYGMSLNSEHQIDWIDI